MGGSKVNPGGGGVEELRKIFINHILALEFLLPKTLGLTWVGVQTLEDDWKQIYRQVAFLAVII